MNLIKKHNFGAGQAVPPAWVPTDIFVEVSILKASGLSVLKIPLGTWTSQSTFTTVRIPTENVKIPLVGIQIFEKKRFSEESTPENAFYQWQQ